MAVDASQRMLVADARSRAELLEWLERRRPDVVVIDAERLRAILAAERSETADPGLTDRERAILHAISSGMTTPAISRRLWISEHTIKFHLTNIYRKLGVRNRAGAVRYALEHGLAGTVGRDE